MKRAVPLLLAVLLALCRPADAAPLLYTFDGFVTSTTGQTGGLSVGDAVQYRFLVDFDRPGVEIYPLTGVHELTDFVGVDSHDYFYSEYVGGDDIPPPAGTAIGAWRVYNYGADTTWRDAMNFAHSGALLGTTVAFSGSFLTIFGQGYASDWTVGQSLGGLDSTDADEYYEAESRLTLTSITPVPEPSTMLLLGGGLIGLLGLKRRRKS